MSTATTVVVRLLFIVVTLLGVTACSGGASGPNAAGGSVPEIASLELSPQPAYANNALTIVITRKALDGPPAHYTYQWRKNGQVINGAAGEILPNTLFRKGDVVTATVTATDGQKPGASMTSRPVAIHNSAPIITAMAVTPVMLSQQVTARAVAQGSDVDGDAITYTYQWFKNEVEITGQTAESLDGAGLVRGDRIQVRVTPFDGEVAGEGQLSTAVTVGNTPPRITSQPPASLNADDTYLYQVVAEDLDGDAIGYSLMSAPAGMTIDPLSGLIRWKVTRTDRGLHPIEIAVANADGAKTMQRYDLRIDDLAEKSAPPPPHS